MDRNIAPTSEVDRLIRIAESSRAHLSGEIASLRHKLDFPSRVRGSVKAHPSGWLLGSLTTGFAASRLFRRKPAAPTPKQKKGMALTLFGLMLAAARPLAKTWVLDQAKQYFARQQASGFTTRANPGSFPTQNPL